MNTAKNSACAHFVHRTCTTALYYNTNSHKEPHDARKCFTRLRATP